MAKTRIVIAVLAAMLSHSLRGDSLKTAEFANSANVLRMVEFYHSKTGELPNSWSEVEKFVDFKTLFKNFDFRSEYGFPKSELRIKRDGKYFRIIVMSIASKPDVTNQTTTSSLRLLLLYRKDNLFEVFRIGENELEQMIQDDGKKLSDYTGSNGSWSNLTELNVSSSQESMSVSDHSNDMSDQNNLGTETGASEKNLSSLSNRTTQLIVGCICFLVIGSVIFTFWLFRRKSSIQSRMK